MKFISPKVDYAFKRIFGSDDSNDILMSFLNGIIYEGQKVIQCRFKLNKILAASSKSLPKQIIPSS